jgi:hypothetical protein
MWLSNYIPVSEKPELLAKWDFFYRYQGELN